MILIAGGDSFIFGSELQDQHGVEPSRLTYTALLSDQYALDYRCVARPGNANNAIGRLVMNECVRYQTEKICVMVTWTFTNRYEFRFNYNTEQRYSPWHSINSWSILDDVDSIKNQYHTMNITDLEHQKNQLLRSKKTGISDFAKTFYKHVGDSEYYELYSTLKEIVLLQNYLKINSIPYLFVAADNHFYQHPNYNRQRDEFIDTLYKQIDWQSWYFFEAGTKDNHTQYPRGFYQWAVENKYPVGTTHPLEHAHSAAADLIKEKFNEMVTKSLE